MIGCSLLSALLLAIWYSPGADPTRVYYGTDTRLFSIWMGSALAFIWPSTHLKRNSEESEAGIEPSWWSFFYWFSDNIFVLDDHLSFVYYGGMLLVSLLCTILVAVTAHPGASLNRWLTNPLFSYIGKRSYGIYLYQFPVMIFMKQRLGMSARMFSCIH